MLQRIPIGASEQNGSCVFFDGIETLLVEALAVVLFRALFPVQFVFPYSAVVS